MKIYGQYVKITSENYELERWDGMFRYPDYNLRSIRSSRLDTKYPGFARNADKIDIDIGHAIQKSGEN